MASPARCSRILSEIQRRPGPQFTDQPETESVSTESLLLPTPNRAKTSEGRERDIEVGRRVNTPLGQCRSRSMLVASIHGDNRICLTNPATDPSVSTT